MNNFDWKESDELYQQYLSEKYQHPNLTFEHWLYEHWLIQKDKKT